MSEPKVSTRAAHSSAGSNLPVNRIVVHATCPILGFPKATAAGQAKATARYFTDAAAGGSAHYIEDLTAEEHCLPDSSIAWHAPPNAHSVGVEMCADGGAAAAYSKHPAANYTRAQWLDPKVWPMVLRTARRVAELCDRFNVPKVRLSAADLRAGKRGICGHVDVSQAFGQTDHSDPGPAFPWDEFMAAVRGEGEDDMYDDKARAQDADTHRLTSATCSRVQVQVVPAIRALAAGQKAILDALPGVSKATAAAATAAVEKAIDGALSPEAIAESIPDSLAQQVVDALAARLAGGVS